MQKGTCIICNESAGYGRLMCENCLRAFDFAEYGDEVDSATYSAEDDKLRLYSGRVSEPLFAALATTGFRRAPRQELFYGVWAPFKEDALLELCNEILDEDSTLEDRAFDRADRFATYSDNAGRRARSAQVESDRIAERFAGGQPILIGHHSEKRARRDQERIHNKMRQAIGEFDRRDYWSSRSKNSEQHAAYMLAQGTVINRIKKLEAALRKQKKQLTECDEALKAWDVENITVEQAHHAANYYSVSKKFFKAEYPNSTYEGYKSVWSALDDGMITPEQAQEISMRVYLRNTEKHQRWLEHYEHLLIYWKLFLQETYAQDIDRQHEIKKGQWVQLVSWNKPTWGQVVRVNHSRATKRITTVSVDRATMIGDHYTWKWPYKNIKNILDHRPIDNEVYMDYNPQPSYQPPVPDPERKAAVEKAAVAEAIEIVVNHDPDFYPTPMPLVKRMIEIADIRPGHLCLEPSAGDGRIATAMLAITEKYWSVVAFDINYAAQKLLEEKFGKIDNSDFLEYNPKARFDRIVMNPPFSKEQDIIHVLHAYDLLALGGRLVAIMSEHTFFASNSRASGFRDWLDTVGHSEQLPANTFKEVGTHVNTRLVMIDKPPAQVRLW